MTAFVPLTRRLFTLAAIAGAAVLSGCASLHSVSSEVASFGTWPADQVPGTYSFDRLPSQQSNLQRSQSLEAAAAQALATAGFKPAPEGTKASFTVQIGARIERFERSPWDDPLWMPGLYRGYPYPGWYAPYGPGGPYGPFWRPWGLEPDRYEREVALLIRDGAAGKPLYEARATNGGATQGGDRMLAAMFDAAMKDFPHANERRHTVTVELPLVPDAH